MFARKPVSLVLTLVPAIKQRTLILLLSPSLRQSQELFRKVLDAYHAGGKAVPIKQESALRLKLANGSRVIALPGTEETTRGFSGVSLLVKPGRLSPSTSSVGIDEAVNPAVSAAVLNFLPAIGYSSIAALVSLPG